ncbi:MAG TPA: histidinol-phosphate transaminase [Deltaproteobacteria bacterium]|jgi:histidinol-phosphate aminotransferase|nr:histidinol-phosphate transaminase [Deltaproteobacteria bacterium]HOA45728.1 histidinol-phosphate transaminase [Deltaproteobacteria bacterium]HOC76894.1 histidinol-phosphate transaminase [Deltaproteobacteria bacterium]HOY76037.1 histidinol-phosphate transaminase [Deltaproteobacteria bacterium]HPA76803.1 histidinol-phosphate transaminase [Deltaproteobacteria bacterium]
MKVPEPAPWVSTIPEYVPGRSKTEIAREYGVASPIKLASNENPLGPSPKALAAMHSACGDAHLYPDPDSLALRVAAARFFGSTPDRIVAGNGSDEIIDLVCRAYLRPGDEVVIPACTFSYYGIAARACGAVVTHAPMRELRIDVTGIVESLGGETRIVFVANPNNPTGTCLVRDEVLELMNRVPRDVLVVMDEAYGAFTRTPEFTSCVGLVGENPNLVTVHTLSKSHGLAGMRVGFGIAPRPVLENMLRIKPPFNVNHLAQKAGEAALDDKDFLRRTLKITWDGLDMLYASFDRLGLPYVPSQTNFVTVHIGEHALRVYETLLRKGIITRSMASFGLEEYIRVSVGTPGENDAFVAALEEAL